MFELGTENVSHTKIYNMKICFYGSEPDKTGKNQYLKQFLQYSRSNILDISGLEPI